MKKWLGFTLLELLMVIIFETILLSCLLKLYIATKNNEQVFLQLNAIQENAKAAINILQAEIKSAGYIGCQRLSKNFVPISKLSYNITLDNRIQGNANEIIVRKLSPVHTNLIKKMTQKNLLIVGKEIKISPQDILLISDCHHAELFQAQNVYTNKLVQRVVPTSPLYFEYSKDAELGKFEINKFYLGKTKRKDNKNNFIYSLFFENIKHQRHEIIERLNKMSFNYLVNRSNELVELDASQIIDWSEVRGVTITFIFTYGNLHKTWYSTIALAE